MIGKVNEPEYMNTKTENLSVSNTKEDGTTTRAKQCSLGRLQGKRVQVTLLFLGVKRWKELVK